MTAGDPSHRPDRFAAPDVCVENVSFGFPGEEIFRSLNFKMASGRWTCLIGPSGVGKSTLLRIISGSLRKGFSGTVRYGTGTDPRGITAWMAQKDLLLPWLTVIQNVCLGARLRGALSDPVRQKAETLLESVGLGSHRDALPTALSGGMRQRVALLRTLMEQRPVILMDEPFSALDALTRLKLQDLASRLVAGATVLMVTHDPLEALRLGDRIYVMTGSPARIGEALVPPGKPPRSPGDREIVALQAELIERLEAGFPP